LLISNNTIFVGASFDEVFKHCCTPFTFETSCKNCTNLPTYQGTNYYSIWYRLTVVKRLLGWFELHKIVTRSCKIGEGGAAPRGSTSRFSKPFNIQSTFNCEGLRECPRLVCFLFYLHDEKYFKNQLYISFQAHTPVLLINGFIVSNTEKERFIYFNKVRKRWFETIRHRRVLWMSPISMFFVLFIWWKIFKKSKFTSVFRLIHLFSL
jgi:hypothetical protein